LIIKHYSNFRFRKI